MFLKETFILSRMKCNIFQHKIGSRGSKKLTNIFFEVQNQRGCAVARAARGCGCGCVGVGIPSARLWVWVWASASVRAWAGVGRRRAAGWRVGAGVGAFRRRSGVAVGMGVGASQRGSEFWRVGGCVGVKFKVFFFEKFYF